MTSGGWAAEDGDDVLARSFGRRALGEKPKLHPDSRMVVVDVIDLADHLNASSEERFGLLGIVPHDRMEFVGREDGIGTAASPRRGLFSIGQGRLGFIVSSREADRDGGKQNGRNGDRRC